MIIEQTVDIPADRRGFLDLPRDIPLGKAGMNGTGMSLIEVLRYNDTPENEKPAMILSTPR